ncbi:hypothetical protein CI789_22575 (plasmid) [Erwinia persicina]|nr:hypothetical protein CI789_22575 [Erwinia persicina]
MNEHPPKRQQQAAVAKAPEITPFASQAPQSPFTGVKRGYLNFFIADNGFRLFRGRYGLAEYTGLSPATPGVRRRSASVPPSTSSGASMPLKRHPGAGLSVLASL